MGFMTHCMAGEIDCVSETSAGSEMRKYTVENIVETNMLLLTAELAPSTKVAVGGSLHQTSFGPFIMPAAAIAVVRGRRAYA